MDNAEHRTCYQGGEKLQSAEFWGLLFDESEDITKTEQEIVNIVSVPSNGEFTSDFLGLTEPGADRTAQAITGGLVRLFHDAGLDDWTTKFCHCVHRQGCC